VSCFFLLLCAWLLYRDVSGIVMPALSACTLHEMGHCAALRMTGNSVRRLHITVFGAEIVADLPMDYRQELVVAAAGPGLNLVLACLFCRVPDGTAFAGVNLALAAFNCLPVGELDGARILRCILALLISYERAANICRCLGFGFTIAFSLFGVCMAVRNRNLTMFLMSLWLLMRPAREKTLQI